MRQTGVIHQISSNGGGVPKLPVSTAEVDVTGIVGDVQADRRYHGAPHQALCWFSLEIIEALREEGHSIHPGAAGENLTVSGVDWARIRPGMPYRIGQVTGTISSYAVPCGKNARWFHDRKPIRMSQDVHPGWSRLYSDVVSGGTIAAGDEVVFG